MTLLRPDLYRSNHLESLLHDVFSHGDPFLSFWREPTRSASSRKDWSKLRADFFEGPDGFHTVFELPGVSKDDVNLELENSVLRVNGTLKEKRGEDETSYEFSRSLALPDEVDAAKISAEMKDGLLTIDLPKREETKARSIEIK
ncbi:MAG: Hsp20/alpha crystallin family protein [Verrucomicrobiota bacterium]